MIPHNIPLLIKETLIIVLTNGIGKKDNNTLEK
jgi:hypothetical protein